VSPTSTTRIVLYTQDPNPFSDKVRGALVLKRLDFERIVSNDPEDVHRWSPIERTLPVLEIDGRRVADSARILDWLEERFPEPPLYSPDPKTAEAQRKLADWSESSFLWYWNRWRAVRYPQPGDETAVDESLLARLKGRLGLGNGKARMTRADLRELEVVDELIERVDDLIGFLGDRPYFHAESPSVADLSVYAMLRVLRTGPIPRCRKRIDESQTLTGFIDRMAEQIPLTAPAEPGP